jgi:hypothetical protein
MASSDTDIAVAYLQLIVSLDAGSLQKNIIAGHLTCSTINALPNGQNRPREPERPYNHNVPERVFT